MSNPMLFDFLPEGCRYLKDFLSEDEQRTMLDHCRSLLATHPLCQPTTKKGYPLSLKVSSWGKVGWFGGNGEYSYIKTHPRNGKPWPPIPLFIDNLIEKALATCGFDSLMVIDTVLLNWYPAGKGKLGRHQDVTEEDLVSPIVTFSLGDTGIFNIGSMEYDDPGQDLGVHSGDCIVMGGPSRLAYHGIKSLNIKPVRMPDDLLPDGGRISLTARKVFV